jgi:hypothetical protein
MKLSGSDGQSVALSVVRYEFPEIRTEEYDSNWLVIAGEITHLRGTWSFCDPCLLNYEALDLASWLESLASGMTLPSICSFIEPELEFHAVQDEGQPTLRVYFEFGSRPSWAPFPNVRKGDLRIEIPFNEIDFRTAAAAWREELKAYPLRAPR